MRRPTPTFRAGNRELPVDPLTPGIFGFASGDWIKLQSLTFSLRRPLPAANPPSPPAVAPLARSVTITPSTHTLRPAPCLHLQHQPLPSAPHHTCRPTSSTPALAISTCLLVPSKPVTLLQPCGSEVVAITSPHQSRSRLIDDAVSTDGRHRLRPDVRLVGWRAAPLPLTQSFQPG